MFWINEHYYTAEDLRKLMPPWGHEMEESNLLTLVYKIAIEIFKSDPWQHWYRKNESFAKCFEDATVSLACDTIVKGWMSSRLSPAEYVNYRLDFMMEHANGH